MYALLFLGVGKKRIDDTINASSFMDLNLGSSWRLGQARVCRLLCGSVASTQVPIIGSVSRFTLCLRSGTVDIGLIDIVPDV